MPTPHTPDRHRALQALFEAALERDAEGRAALIAETCAQDTELARDLVALLEAHGSDSDRFETRVNPAIVNQVLGLGEPWRGKRVGAYEVAGRIGAGGMGDVYRAVRADQQFSKEVAIKFLRRSAESELAIRRFRYERQILATLNHRNIAALLDGGVTEDGQPYFVMELVEGSPITTWCDERRLGVAARLALFRQVCGAVQHAHQQLVVHRDLKPGNILVTEDGTVKLLDFGIAKLLREEEGNDLLPPTHGARIFTPEYAAPEQVRGLPVGTPADVYALGVVLFELVTGRRPFDLQGLLISEIEEIVCNSPAPAPSDFITADRLEAVGERSFAKARRQLVGDVDAIVLNALRKEPERRYGSAEQFARDIALHLSGMPVTARPDGLGYRIGKLIRRRKVELIGASFAVVSLLGGSVASTLYARKAAEERDRVREVTSFLSSMLSAVDPSQLGREVTMREVLDSAAVRADSLAGRPLLEREIRDVIAGTYLALGAYDQALEEYRKGLAAARRAESVPGHQVAQGLSQLSIGYEYIGDYAIADSIFSQALLFKERLGYRSKLERLEWMEHRGRLLGRLGRFDEAIPYVREALALHLDVAPRNDSANAYYYHNLAVLVGEIGNQDEADSLFRTALELERSAVGEVHPLYAASLSAYSTVLERLGRFDAVDSTMREVLRIRAQMLGEEHPDYAWSMFNYADFLVNDGRPAEAAMWARRVLALRGRTLDDTHPAVSTGMQVLGRALAGLDSLDQAEALMRESLKVREDNFPPGHWVIASSVSHLGAVIARRGRFAEAESLLVTSERRLVELRGEEAPPVRDARKRLVMLYEEWNRPDEAARWRALLEESPAED
jgi:serine/threonine protein kinase/tetratricopeptide (TPR) repeat protein